MLIHEQMIVQAVAELDQKLGEGGGANYIFYI